MSSKPRICFVAYNLYPYLKPGAVSAAGGSERQQSLIAKELQHRGYEIAAIVGDYDQPSYERIGGIDVWKSYSSYNEEGYQSIRGAACVPKQISKFMIALRRVDADIYYTRTSLYYPLLYIYSILSSSKYICGLSNDSDVEKSSINKKNTAYKSLYLRSLSKADAVISQTEYQKRKLASNFGIDSEIVPNGYPLVKSSSEGGDYFLWVGRAQKSQKRPDLFLEVASNLPDISFVMIVAPGQYKGYFNELKHKASKITNLRFEGFVPPDEIHGYYEEAIALINTSQSEGFPNTFLEAWRFGTPVISLRIDLGGILETEDIGLYSGSVSTLCNDIIQMRDNPDLVSRMGVNATRYIEENHSMDSVIHDLESVIHRLIDCN